MNDLYTKELYGPTLPSRKEVKKKKKKKQRSSSSSSSSSSDSSNSVKIIETKTFHNPPDSRFQQSKSDIKMSRPSSNVNDDDEEDLEDFLNKLKKNKGSKSFSKK